MTNRNEGLFLASFDRIVVSLLGSPCVLAGCFLLFATSIIPDATEAAGEESRPGHGHLTIGYQHQTADTFQATTGEIPIGPIDTHALNVEIEYYLTDRLTLIAGLPYIHRRYQGRLQHDPLLLDPPRPEVENVDQGKWNNAFQDFHLGMRYLVRTSPITIEPHLYLGVPSHEYPFFGHAAVGQHQARLEIGSSFVFSPGLSDAYYGFDVSYALVEKVLGVDINHWRLNAEVGYFFTPRLAGRIFAMAKEGRGLDFPDDFPAPRTDERWYQHDRMVKHNYTNMGLGVTWSLRENYRLSTSWMTMTRADSVHVMDSAIDFTVTRSF